MSQLERRTNQMHSRIVTQTDGREPLATVDVITASLYGKLAIHRSIGQLGYTLTHIPTGFAVRARMVSYRDAEDLMLLMEDKADWNFRSPTSKKWKAQTEHLRGLVETIPVHPTIY
jgi:hypothetical protein